MLLREIFNPDQEFEGPSSNERYTTEEVQTAMSILDDEIGKYKTLDVSQIKELAKRVYQEGTFESRNTNALVFVFERLYVLLKGDFPVDITQGRAELFLSDIPKKFREVFDSTEDFNKGRTSNDVLGIATARIARLKKDKKENVLDLKEVNSIFINFCKEVLDPFYDELKRDSKRANARLTTTLSEFSNIYVPFSVNKRAKTAVRAYKKDIADLIAKGHNVGDAFKRVLITNDIDLPEELVERINNEVG